MILYGVMAVILHYLTEFDSSGGQLFHTCWSYTHTVCNKNAAQAQKNLVFSNIKFMAIFSENYQESALKRGIQLHSKNLSNNVQ